nr:class I SAM-dependent methyltransferase [uncultured Butyrivibrio sp.]
MPVFDGLEWTFDTAASAYEKMRPGYVPELYKAIFDYCDIGEDSNLIEVGIGGGQATLPFLQRGCSVTAIEYGEKLSAICREKFSVFPKFSVITSKFEDARLDDNKYDLIYSASAFHWIPEEIGYTKVYNALKKGGVFARFSNHPFRCKNELELAKAIDEAYRKYYYPFHNKQATTPSEYTEEQAEKRARIAEKYGFEDMEYRLFHRIREFSAEEYIELIGTYSDHIAIDEPIRKRFFGEIKQAINEHGGFLKLYDTMDLQLVRKR